MSTTVSCEIEKQGEQAINQPRDWSQPENEHWVYLSGTEEIRQKMMATSRYHRNRNSLLKGQYTLTRIENLRHQSGEIHIQHEVAVTMLQRF